MAQYKVTYTLYEDSSHSTSQPGMFSLTQIVTAETNSQAVDIVKAILGPTAAQYRRRCCNSIGVIAQRAAALVSVAPMTTAWSISPAM
jgi:hypothetical protein